MSAFILDPTQEVQAAQESRRKNPRQNWTRWLMIQMIVITASIS